MRIYGREISYRSPPYFIAEIGANHDGDLDRALRLIELAADAGADAVKFQHLEAATIVSRRGFADLGKMAHQAAWDKDVYEVYEKASVPRYWTEHLSAYAHDHGMAFITTPYSLELADVVEPYVDAYKIGSGDVTYHALIRDVGAKGKPVLIATGASNQNEVDSAVSSLRAGGHSVRDTHSLSAACLMACSTDYTGNENFRYLNLSTLSGWRERYSDFAMGFSDHTPGHTAVLAAIALGARVIEKHFTDDKGRKGPDHAFALDPVEWCQMIDDSKRVYEALGDGIKRVEENEREARIVQRRALRYRTAMQKGAIVGSKDLIATRPCPPGAMEPYEAPTNARMLNRDVTADELVRRGDLQ
jgi:sialic acid synthase SpsE